MRTEADGSDGKSNRSATSDGPRGLGLRAPEAHGDAYGFDVGGVYGNFSGDVVVQRVNHAFELSTSCLVAPQRSLAHENARVS
jgi:hypothetical protein